MKLVAKNSLRGYELTYLLPVTYTESELKGIREEVQAILLKYKVTDITTEDWGKRKLAYKIKFAGAHQTEAAYFYATFVADPAAIVKISRDLQLHDKIMRYLTIVIEEKAVKEPKKEAKKKVEAKTEEVKAEEIKTDEK